MQHLFKMLPIFTGIINFLSVACKKWTNIVKVSVIPGTRPIYAASIGCEPCGVSIHNSQINILQNGKIILK